MLLVAGYQVYLVASQSQLEWLASHGKKLWLAKWLKNCQI